MNLRAPSFEPNATRTIVSANGARVLDDAIEQSERLARRMYEVRPGVWTLVGNGLSNQSFVEGPDGVIAIDSGESIQEMNAALDELAAVCDRPVVAVLCTHFHYVSGTQAVIDRFGEVPIYGHARIDTNWQRVGGEIAPTYSRGIVEQFAIVLPDSGPDAVEHVGLGLRYHNATHAPFTRGFVSPSHTFDAATTLHVAGLSVEVTPAPSDADDSVTFWFPELGVAVHNLVWPLLFNIFAIRGEEYRDPRVLLRGIDHLIALGADHLIGTHGPPLSGAHDVERRATLYRDSIAFMWDQTVRLTNRGATGNDLAHQIRLPEQYNDDYLTRESYGVVEHHVRQIRSGLFGFFDGDESALFPVPAHERSARLIAGFGGRDNVRSHVREALAADELRWATELATWLVHSDECEAPDRELLATALREIAARTPAANIRNWCLTRARDLDGTFDMSGFRAHRLRFNEILATPLCDSVSVLRVLVEPREIDGLDVRIGWHCDDEWAALHVRNGVAVPMTAPKVDATLHCTKSVWAALASGRTTWDDAVADGSMAVSGNAAGAHQFLRALDVASLRPA